MDAIPGGSFSELLFLLSFWLPLLLAVALPIWGVVDALQTPPARWQEARHNRLAWIALIVLLPVLGSVLYALVVRPRLRARPA